MKEASTFFTFIIEAVSSFFNLVYLLLPTYHTTLKKKEKSFPIPFLVFIKARLANHCAVHQSLPRMKKKRGGGG